MDKGKRKVSFSSLDGPTDWRGGGDSGASTSGQHEELVPELDGRPFLSLGEDAAREGDLSSDFKALCDRNSKLVYKELIPELSRIRESLISGSNELRRALGADSVGQQGFEAVRSFPVKILRARLDSEGVLDEGGAGVKDGTEGVGAVATQAKEEGGEVDPGGGFPAAKSGGQAEAAGPRGDTFARLAEAASTATTVERDRVRRRKEATLEKKVQEISDYLERARDEKPPPTMAETSRSVGVPRAVRDVRFKSDSNLNLRSDKLQFIRGMKSMQYSKLVSAQRRVRPLQDRSKGVDKELHANQKQMLIDMKFRKQRARSETNPALGSQQRQWLPGDAHGDSKNKYAHYHSTVSARRTQPGKKQKVAWEGSQFKVTLLQELSTKLRLKVHFASWKCAYDTAVSLSLLVAARTNKANRATKRVFFEELKKLVVQLRSKTEQAVRDIEQFLRKRNLRIWLEYCKREQDLRVRFEHCFSQSKIRLRRRVMLAWIRQCKREISLRKSFHALQKARRDIVRRSVLSSWMSYTKREFDLHKKFLHLSLVHEERMKKSVMMYWKFRVVRKSIKDINVGLASVFWRMRMVHIVVSGWKGVVLRMRNLRRAVYSDRGGAGATGGAESSVYIKEDNKKLARVLSEMKKAKSVLMPKVRVLQDMQPTLWESTIEGPSNEGGRRIQKDFDLQEIWTGHTFSDDDDPVSDIDDQEEGARLQVAWREHKSPAKTVRAFEIISASVNPARSPSRIERAPAKSRTMEDIRSQYIAAMTGMIPVEQRGSKVELTTSGTSPVHGPRMVDATIEAIEEVESQDMATITTVTASSMVSAGTTPVRGPRMVDATIEAIEEVESQDMATITTVTASSMVSAGTTPVRGPRMVDATIEAIEEVESRDAATTTEETTALVATAKQAEPEMVSAGTTPVKALFPTIQGYKPLCSDEDVVESGDQSRATVTEENENVSKRLVEEFGTDGGLATEAIEGGGVSIVVMPPVNVVGGASSDPTSAIHPPIQSLKELAEEFYHRNLSRRILRAVKVQIARSKHIGSLAEESYKWHVNRYYLNIWYHNTVVVGRIAGKRGAQVILLRHLRAWERFAAASKSLKDRSKSVERAHKVHRMLSAFKHMRRAHSQSRLLKAKLAEYREKGCTRCCQKVLHIWRLWSNLHITRRVAVLRVIYRMRLRVKRQCLMAWWQVQQSSKLLKRVLVQTSKMYETDDGVESTLENTFSLLMRVLYAWKRLIFVKKGSMKANTAASMLQKSLGALLQPKISQHQQEQQLQLQQMDGETKKKVESERLRGSCHKMFLLWYLLSRSLSEDSSLVRSRLQSETRFRTEFQYRRNKLISRSMGRWKSALVAKENAARMHYIISLCRRCLTAWQDLLLRLRQKEHLAFEMCERRLMRFTFWNWNVSAREKIMQKVLRLRLTFEHWKGKVLRNAMTQSSPLGSASSARDEVEKGVVMDADVDVSEARKTGPEGPEGVAGRRRLVVTRESYKVRPVVSETPQPQVAYQHDGGAAHSLSERPSLGSEFKHFSQYISSISTKHVSDDTVKQLEELRCQWKLDQLLQVRSYVLGARLAESEFFDA
ncbi:hypothetical protein A3770_01p04890 [Chloropicon primus]|uniref:Sfi1 spindle body domain-containing protein n=1 Tax=Chloropicon primus TaxID=1764295 RepID=A0A5B8MCS3_9CHLO|nr:hypothetical protein A3770_01p04890 [Chloropicon primus]|eukprot:QDZ17971.1 hypothetical protein A3770_01p04890 [Chloropicon primus]